MSSFTPGVYIVEPNAFPNSALAVDTAVPVFIGYTQTAQYGGVSLLRKPTRISSLADYIGHFGGAFPASFHISAQPGAVANGAGTASLQARRLPGNDLYFYNSIRLFFANGGGTCYVLSIGTYEQASPGTAIAVKKEDYLGDGSQPGVFEILEKETEPTLLVLPDLVATADPNDVYEVYSRALAHCSRQQSRFCILDVPQASGSDTPEAIRSFREHIGTDALQWGAAYFPWLQTSVVSAAEIGLSHIVNPQDLQQLLPETEAKKAAAAIGNEAKGVTKENLHKTLLACSPTYTALVENIRTQLNLLPPSGAMAGIYTAVDNSRGVWKAPANVSLSLVDAPSIAVSHELQEQLNVDVMGGKSINALRSFPGVGVLVWGARTLDGNSMDWRYVNVRRTLIMIEQSLRLACRAFVFQPNDATTWVAMRSMMSNFLSNLWKQGALAGSTPADAFDVSIGLGSTMTPTDILEGRLIVSVKVAVVRPAEFIVIGFQQQMQPS